MKGGKGPGQPGGGPQNWRIRLETMFTKMEFMGVKAANFMHKGFINMMLMFMAWNLYSFGVNYNNYWRLRRDPNLPRQWLEEQTRPGEADYDIERERAAREERLSSKDDGKAK